jgi:hypothetical protein
MDKFFCNQIECKDLAIVEGEEMIRLHAVFENNGDLYDVYLIYFDKVYTWSLEAIYHRYRTCCHNCKENYPKHQQLDNICNFFSNYQTKYPEKIVSEIIIHPVIQEKINNFRLEAITHGFDI